MPPKRNAAASAASAISSTSAKAGKHARNSSITEPCPRCPTKPGRGRPKKIDDDSVDWIGCDQCSTWFHWHCVTDEPVSNLENIDKWYCSDCLEAASSSANPLTIQYNNAPRKSARSNKSTNLNYANLHQGLEPDPHRFYHIVQSKPITPHEFKVLPDGEGIDEEWVLHHPESMLEPLIIENKEGLGMRVPSDQMTINQVAQLVGTQTPVEVIDVASQSDLANWTLGQWAAYYSDPKRSKVRNVISLEVSDTALAAQISPPAAVKAIDWVDTIWPKHRKGKMEYPKVQKYCLMSVAKCWTDWHVDFAASSVWYHILKGSKTFYFIKPTTENLKKYERWSGSSDRQENTWLGDEVDHVYEVKLTQGNTMIIPTGWIHAVYTPSDSLVFGGNFLHSLNIGTQLELYRIEIATKVPRKFRFPMFVRFLWYVAKHYTKLFQALEGPVSPTSLPDEVTPRILQGLKALSVFLIEQARRIDESSTASSDQRKWATDHVPWEEIPRPDKLCSQFRALVLQGLGRTEEEEGLQSAAKRSESPAVALSRKRKQSSEPPTVSAKHARLKNFNSNAAASPRTKASGALAAGGNNGAAEVKAPETITSRSRMGRPLEDDSIGDEEEVEVKTTTSETRVTRTVRAAGKVIRETRTVTTVVERVVWDKLPEEEPKAEDAEDQLAVAMEAMSQPEMRQSEASPMARQESQDSNMASIKEETPIEPVSLPAGLSDFAQQPEPMALPPGLSDFLPKLDQQPVGDQSATLPPGLSDFMPS